jgi:hypothetical protein
MDWLKVISRLERRVVEPIPIHHIGSWVFAAEDARAMLEKPATVRDH